MKKICLFATMLISLFFSFTAKAADKTFTNSYEIYSVISEYYPNLKDYYDAGVMKVESLTETTLMDGSTEYDIKYKFVKNYYDNSEIDVILKEKYPDIYFMSKAGILKDVSIYRFVDKSTGNILTNVVYNRAEHKRPQIPPFVR